MPSVIATALLKLFRRKLDFHDLTDTLKQYVLYYI